MDGTQESPKLESAQNVSQLGGISPRKICKCGGRKSKLSQMCVNCFQKIINKKREEKVISIRNDESKSWRTRYIKYINTKHWKELRSRKRESVGNKCESCQSESILHVHHLKYKNWIDVQLEDLRVLCENCHKKEHQNKN